MVITRCAYTFSQLSEIALEREFMQTKNRGLALKGLTKVGIFQSIKFPRQIGLAFSRVQH